MQSIILTSIIAIFMASCATQSTELLDSNKEFTFLALGDSYTIGEAVGKNERWPEQLATKLKEDSVIIQPTIVATTGWTTDELISGIVKAEVQAPYDFVTLLIGVNNQYRGYNEDQYEKEFKLLLEKAIHFANGNPRHVIVISIPDYGVTPFAVEKNLDKRKIAHELDSYNAIAQKMALLRDVPFVDITPISRTALVDSTFIAQDGLHPSGKMYALWVDHMYKTVYNGLLSR